MSRNWIAVAATEHVRKGRMAGFMQVAHGKAVPLRRIKPGDRVVYYSPTGEFRGTDKLQAFTAIGVVKAGEPYEFDLGGGFCAFRRDVQWIASCETPILPLLGALDFSTGKRNWGYQLHFGLFPISDHDLDLIAEAMGAKLPAEVAPGSRLPGRRSKSDASPALTAHAACAASG
jgi:hypothetical protein